MLGAAVPETALNVSGLVPVFAWWFVTTVTVACTVPVPFNVTCVGETLHVTSASAPLQGNDTLPVKPFTGDSVNVYVPDLPRNCL